MKFCIDCMHCVPPQSGDLRMSKCELEKNTDYLVTGERNALMYCSSVRITKPDCEDFLRIED